jgi:hypothetical protein
LATYAERTSSAAVAPGDGGADLSAIGTALLNTIAASAATDYVASHRSAPQLPQLAAVHSYTVVFWWAAAIFTAGAILCGAILRPGPLARPADAWEEPTQEAAPARS